MKTKQKTQENNYPEIVHQIHEEFMTEGERLFDEAKQHLEYIAMKEQKILLLDAIGFGNVKEVAQKRELLVEKQITSRVASIINRYAIKYPAYKFITEESVEKICEKYSLVWGSIESFTGFVPYKNAKDIKKFFRTVRYEDIEVISTDGWFGTKKHKPLQELLYICAPQKDFDMNSYEISGTGYKVQKKSPPDPVVLFKVPDGFIIITAWGDEAQDPMVINEKQN